MANFTGEIATNTALFIVGTQDGYGTIDQLTITNLNVDGYGQPRLTALAAAGINPIPYYKLSCEDNTGLRHYWVDVAISLTRAPPGFTYVSATLVNEGKF